MLLDGVSRGRRNHGANNEKDKKIAATIKIMVDDK
jgi:hypothetical protein